MGTEGTAERQRLLAEHFMRIYRQAGRQKENLQKDKSSDKKWRVSSYLVKTGVKKFTLLKFVLAQFHTFQLQVSQDL